MFPQPITPTWMTTKRGNRKNKNMPAELDAIDIQDTSLSVDPAATIQSGVELDKLFTEMSGKKPDGTDPEPAPPAGTEPPPAAPPTEPPAGTEPPPAAPPAGTEPPAQPPVEPPAATTPPATPPPANPADEFEKVELPPHTKPKTGEAFGKVKELARQAVTAERAKAADLLKQVETLTKQVQEFSGKPAITPEVQAELEDLRKFRLSKDVEADPEFQRFDKAVSDNNAAILKKLADNGMTEAQIAQINALGGPEQVDWEPLWGKLPVQIRRFIEAKLVDNVTLRDNRAAALDKAKANAEAYTKERETRTATELATHVTRFSSQVPWLTDKPITGTEADKAAAVQHNKAAAELRTQLAEFTKVQTPERFAEYAVCTLFATRMQAENKALAERIGTAEKSLAAITAERDKAVKELEAIRRAEGGRRPGTATAAPSAPRVSSLNVSAGEALDALRAQLAGSEE